MKTFDYMEKYGYEQLVYFCDVNTGLKAITCIHSTVLGPSLGGTRFWNYATEDEAVEDALRLAKGMTYKSACAGLNLGGGKSVIIGDKKELVKDSVKLEAFWRSFGRYIQGLNGRYITAEDVNTTTADMDFVNMETNYVAGLAHKSGDPSPFTALGVFRALQASCKVAYGDSSTKGKVVAVQGLGHVGMTLCQYLHDDGATLFVTDIEQDRVNEAVTRFGAKAVSLDEIYDVDCDIYAPCALGATVNDDTIPRLKCKVICGAANNVLKEAPVHGKVIQEKGLIYAPDYVANAGGIINVYEEIKGYNEAASRRAIDKIYDRVIEILTTSADTGKPTYQVADEMAERRLNAMKNVNSIYNK